MGELKVCTCQALQSSMDTCVGQTTADSSSLYFYGLELDWKLQGRSNYDQSLVTESLDPG